MYTLKTEAAFDSAHFLSGYKGKCSNIHGHRWNVSVEISSDALDSTGQKRGMIVDFGDLKHDLKELVDFYDHAFIYESNTLKDTTIAALNSEGFRLINVDFRPTAENFSKCFYDWFKEKKYNVKCVTVYETPNNCASYSE